MKSKYKVSKETRKKISESMIGHVISEETRRKISKTLNGGNSTSFKVGHETSEDVRKKIGLVHKGKHHSPETEFKKGNFMGKENRNWVNIPKELMVELYIKKRKSIIEIAKELKRDKGTITRKLKLYEIPIRNDSESLKAKFENNEFKDRMIRATLKGLMKRPTSFEKKISDLCIEHKLPFIYTGNGTFLIGHKNPDFIDKKRKLAILLSMVGMLFL